MQSRYSAIVVKLSGESEDMLSGNRIKRCQLRYSAIVVKLSGESEGMPRGNRIFLKLDRALSEAKK